MLTITNNASARLVGTLGEIGENPDSWVLVLFNLDKLLEQHKSDYQLKIAVNLILELLGEYEGGIYMIENGAIAVLCNHLSSALMSKLIFQLRYLYMDDPLAYTEEGSENHEFSVVFQLSREWRECMDFCSRLMTRVSRNATRITSGNPRLLTSQRLAEIERQLASVDLTTALRQQSVCAATAQGTIRRVFDEVYVHMPKLRELLKVDVNLTSNQWLFQYLTQLLDTRLLTLMRTEPQRYAGTPISLNMNVQTLASDAFTEFDTALDPAGKVGVVFEVPLVEVFADMAAFDYARDRVQRLGYRLCLDGVTTQSFLQIDRARLKADLIKLQWNADDAARLEDRENRAIQTAVQTCGPSRVILCRCDSKAAIDYGAALGISLLQGRYLDELLHPNAKVRN